MTTATDVTISFLCSATYNNDNNTNNTNDDERNYTSQPATRANHITLLHERHMCVRRKLKSTDSHCMQSVIPFAKHVSECKLYWYAARLDGRLGPFL